MEYVLKELFPKKSLQNSLTNVILFARGKNMEQKNSRKVLFIICITLVVMLFVAGIVFKLIANDKRLDADLYDKQQSLIEQYDKTLPE